MWDRHVTIVWISSSYTQCNRLKIPSINYAFYRISHGKSLYKHLGFNNHSKEKARDQLNDFITSISGYKSVSSLKTLSIDIDEEKFLNLDSIQLMPHHIRSQIKCITIIGIHQRYRIQAFQEEEHDIQSFVAGHVDTPVNPYSWRYCPSDSGTYCSKEPSADQCWTTLHWYATILIIPIRAKVNLMDSDDVLLACWMMIRAFIILLVGLVGSYNISSCKKNIPELN